MSSTVSVPIPLTHPLNGGPLGCLHFPASPYCHDPPFLPVPGGVCSLWSTFSEAGALGVGELSFNFAKCHRLPARMRACAGLCSYDTCANTDTLCFASVTGINWYLIFFCISLNISDMNYLSRDMLTFWLFPLWLPVLAYFSVGFSVFFLLLCISPSHIRISIPCMS